MSSRPRGNCGPMMSSDGRQRKRTNVRGPTPGEEHDATGRSQRPCSGKVTARVEVRAAVHLSERRRQFDRYKRDCSVKAKRLAVLTFNWCVPESFSKD